jgi:ferredoxin-NADP reductase
VARAAVPGRLGGRLSWQTASLVKHRNESDTARTLVLQVPGWPGHLAGQHVDLRLTAEDGYQAVRSYSLAAPARGDLIEITVQEVLDGEVSPYLTEAFSIGDQIEIRGPAGGWFVWRPAEVAPVLLVAGGAGIVPLMAMLRARRAAMSRVPFRLVYSIRTPAELYYRDELRVPQPGDAGLDISYVYTRQIPDGFGRPPARLTVADLNTGGWPADFEPDCFVCGPTGFVEAAANILIALGHDPRRVKTERFGPSGG